MNLTLKQKRFADEYIISGNASDAAIHAGYSKRTASVIGAENLKKPNIKNYIEERLKELANKSIANQEEVLQYLTSVMRGHQKEQTLISQGSEFGQAITEVEVSAKDRLKAAELLGKRYALFTDKQEINLDSEINIRIDYGSDD